MSGVGSARLHARLRQQRARLAVRRWEFRQRDCAKGAWAKLYRTLAEAAEAYAVSEDEFAALLTEGYVVEASGLLLEPPKHMVFVSVERARALTSGRALVLHLTGELLAAERLALVRFA